MRCDFCFQRIVACTSSIARGAPVKQEAARILTASARDFLLRPADTHEGVAPHSLLAGHFSRTAGA